MKLLQVAIDMDFYLDMVPPPAYGTWADAKVGTVEKNVLAAGAFGVACNRCESEIIQGTWYRKYELNYPFFLSNTKPD